MITHNGKYLVAATHHGMPIYAATMGGKMVIGDWLLPLTQQAIVAAFGAEGTEVIRKTNDYLNRIATTDPQLALLLAGFINEDPLLVCSLVETSKTRWLVGDGKAYCNSGIIGNQNITIKARAKMLNKTSVSTYQCVFGSRTANNNREVDVAFIYPSGYFTGFGNTSQDYIAGGGVDVITDFELSKEGAWINGTKVMNGTNNVFTTPTEIALFSRHDQGALNARPLNGAISYVEFGGDTQAHFVPCYTKAQGSGMLDIISGTFYPNANTRGSFTIAITDK